MAPSDGGAGGSASKQWGTTVVGALASGADRSRSAPVAMAAGCTSQQPIHVEIAFGSDASSRKASGRSVARLAERIAATVKPPIYWTSCLWTWNSLNDRDPAASISKSDLGGTKGSAEGALTERRRFLGVVLLCSFFQGLLDIFWWVFLPAWWVSCRSKLSDQIPGIRFFGGIFLIRQDGLSCCSLRLTGLHLEFVLV